MKRFWPKEPKKGFLNDIYEKIQHKTLIMEEQAQKKGITLNPKLKNLRDKVINSTDNLAARKELMNEAFGEGYFDSTKGLYR